MRTAELITRTGAAAAVMVACLAAPTGARPLSNQHPGEVLRAPLDPSLPPYRPSRQLAARIRTVGEVGWDTHMTLWIEAFRQFHPDVQFSLEFKGSTKATAALVGRDADISFVGRPMLPAEVASFERTRGHKPLTLRVAGGTFRGEEKVRSIAVFVNTANPIARLSLDQLDAIYSKTRERGLDRDMASWGALGLSGEWTDKAVVPYVITRTSGTGRFIQQRVLLGGEYKDGVRERRTVEEVVQAVAGDPAGIGYAGFGDARPGTKTVAIAERQQGPYYAGTFQDVVEYKYPLNRFLFIVLDRAPDEPIDPTVKEFLSFVLSAEGQAAVQKKATFTPLSAAILKQERAKLD